MKLSKLKKAIIIAGALAFVILFAAEVLIALVPLLSGASQSPEDLKAKSYTLSEFMKVLNNHTITAVMFWAENDATCLAMKPWWRQIEAQVASSPNATKVAVIDICLSPKTREIFEALRVGTVPVFAVFGWRYELQPINKTAFTLVRKPVLIAVHLGGFESKEEMAQWFYNATRINVTVR